MEDVSQESGANGRDAAVLQRQQKALGEGSVCDDGETKAVICVGAQADRRDGLRRPEQGREQARRDLVRRGRRREHKRGEEGLVEAEHCVSGVRGREQAEVKSGCVRRELDVVRQLCGGVDRLRQHA